MAHRFGYPVARLAFDPLMGHYAKSRDGSEWVADTPALADLPPFLAAHFDGLDVAGWLAGVEQITVFDDGRVERRTVAP